MTQTGGSICVFTSPSSPRWSERAGVRGGARGTAAAGMPLGGGEPRWPTCLH